MSFARLRRGGYMGGTGAAKGRALMSCAVRAYTDLYLYLYLSIYTYSARLYMGGSGARLDVAVDPAQGVI
jgi:hypothetical protein